MSRRSPILKSDLKILIVRNDNIGDLICTTPAIEGLRNHFPTARIDIVVNSYNRVVVEGNPFLDQIWSYAKPKHCQKIWEKGRAGMGKIKLFTQIFKTGYDIAILFRSGYSPSAYQFISVSRARRRLGVGSPDKFTDPIVPVPTHEVLLCFQILKPLGIEYRGERCYFPINSQLSERFKKYSPGIVLHISSRLPQNRPHPIQLKKLIAELKGFQLPIYLTGSPEDWEMGIKLEGGEFIKTYNLKELGAFLSQQDLFITPDGGALHIGGAVGTPTIALFGSSNPMRWAPWGYKKLAIKSSTGRVEDIPIGEILKKVELGLK